MSWYIFSSATFASVGWKCEKSRRCSKRHNEFPYLCPLLCFAVCSAGLLRRPRTDRSDSAGEGGGLPPGMPCQSQSRVYKRLKKNNIRLFSMGKGSCSNFHLSFSWQSLPGERKMPQRDCSLVTALVKKWKIIQITHSRLEIFRRYSLHPLRVLWSRAGWAVLLARNHALSLKWSPCSRDRRFHQIWAIKGDCLLRAKGTMPTVTFSSACPAEN